MKEEESCRRSGVRRRAKMPLPIFGWTGWSDSVNKRMCRFLIHRYLGHLLKEKLSLEQLSVDLYNGTGTIQAVNVDVQVSEAENAAMNARRTRLNASHIHSRYTSVKTASRRFCIQSRKHLSVCKRAVGYVQSADSTSRRLHRRDNGHRPVGAVAQRFLPNGSEASRSDDSAAESDQARGLAG